MTTTELLYRLILKIHEAQMIEKEKSKPVYSSRSMEIKRLHAYKNPNELTNTSRQPKNSLVEHVCFLFMHTFWRMFFIKEI